MNQDHDQPLIERTLLGDVQAFAILVKTYRHMVYTLALKLVRNEADAEEVAQDTFLKAYNAMASFKGESKFSTWLYKIAYHKGLDHLKKEKRQLEVRKLDTHTQYDFAIIENQWDTLEGQERKEVIQKAINKLDGDDGVLITLFYYEELSLIEIARIFGVKPNTIKVRLFRARKRLATLLEKILEPEITMGHGKK
ncbi:RNA polymerase sigma factor [Maribacter sp. 2304DJ31-5]|uniref:RNA polymerase sigma factor n=1 Tax=Maribacter sp. 2304DJ31-5 TaxID=3386273 RepID=UPI0039BCF88E